MASHTIHHIHDTYGDMARRERRNLATTFWVIGGLFFLGGVIGGIIEGEFKLVFWSLLISLALFWVGKKLDVAGIRRKGHRISYD